MHVKLADFGLSATFDPEGVGASFYGVVGTAEYVATAQLTRSYQSTRPETGLHTLNKGTWRRSSCSRCNACAAAAEAEATAAARRGNRRTTSASTGGRRAALSTSCLRAGN